MDTGGGRRGLDKFVGALISACNFTVAFSSSSCLTRMPTSMPQKRKRDDTPSASAAGKKVLISDPIEQESAVPAPVIVPERQGRESFAREASQPRLTPVARPACLLYARVTLTYLHVPNRCLQVCIDILTAAGVKVDCKSELSPAELKAIIGEYDGLIVRSGTNVTASIIELADKMTCIGRAGTGVDNIDCDAATKKGIIVMNTPGGNTVSAAEHTCALIASLARNVAQGDSSMKAGK